MVLRWKWLLVICLSFLASLGIAKETEAQFLTQKIQLIYAASKKTIKVEIAKTELQHERGLMFRKKLNPDQGMLFIFTDEQTRSFWMKNTFIDLSIGYFSKEKKLVEIQEMKAVSSIMQQDPAIYPTTAAAMYALEMNQGWFKKNKISLGSTFKFIGAGP